MIKLSPSILGKITTASQISTVVYVLWANPRTYAQPFFYVTGFFTLLSGCQYILRGIQIVQKKEGLIASKS